MPHLRDIHSDGGARRLLAGLFVFSVLMCHGVFGAAHVSESQAAVVSSPSAMMHEMEGATAQGHGDHHEMKPSDTESVPPAHHLSAEYFAVFFASLLASVMLLVRVGLPGVGTVPLTFRAEFRRLVSNVRPLSRGPTPPALQVFRL